MSTVLAVILEAANAWSCALLATLTALLAAILEALNARWLLATTAPNLETLVAGLHAAITVVKFRITLALELKTLSTATQSLEAGLAHWSIAALAHVSALAADATLADAAVVHVHIPRDVAVTALAECVGILAAGGALWNGLHIGGLIECIISILLLLGEHAGSAGDDTTLACDHLVGIDRIATEWAVGSVLVERLILIIRIGIRTIVGSLSGEKCIDAARCRLPRCEVHHSGWCGCSSTVTRLERRWAILTILLPDIDLILDSDTGNRSLDAGLSGAHDTGGL
jgi:hypothetical protein